MTLDEGKSDRPVSGNFQHKVHQSASYYRYSVHLYLKETERFLAHDEICMWILVAVVLLQALQGFARPALTRGRVEYAARQLVLDARRHLEFFFHTLVTVIPLSGFFVHVVMTSLPLKTTRGL